MTGLTFGLREHSKCYPCTCTELFPIIPLAHTLDLELVALVAITGETGETNVMLLRTAALCNRNDVIEFNLIIPWVSTTVLTGVIVATDHANPGLERDVATLPSGFGRFCESFGPVYNRANMSEDRASHVCNGLRNIWWMVVWRELPQHAFEGTTTFRRQTPTVWCTVALQASQ